MADSKNRPLKPTEIPEDVILTLAKSLGIDTATALDLVMFVQREVRRGGEDACGQDVAP